MVLLINHAHTIVFMTSNERFLEGEKDEDGCQSCVENHMEDYEKVLPQYV